MAIFPAMGAVLALSLLFSSRTAGAQGIVTDRIFPGITRVHAPGEGAFIPGTFAASFFGPAIAGMIVLNLLRPGRFRPLEGWRANVFFYLLFVLVAIAEVAADTLIPILALPAHGFRLAVGAVQALFVGAAALAVLASAGADREW